MADHVEALLTNLGTALTEGVAVSLGEGGTVGVLVHTRLGCCQGGRDGPLTLVTLGHHDDTPDPAHAHTSLQSDKAGLAPARPPEHTTLHSELTWGVMFF